MEKIEVNSSVPLLFGTHSKRGIFGSLLEFVCAIFSTLIELLLGGLALLASAINPKGSVNASAPNLLKRGLIGLLIPISLLLLLARDALLSPPLTPKKVAETDPYKLIIRPHSQR